MIGRALAIFVVDPADVHHVRAFAAHFGCTVCDGSWPGIRGERGASVYGEGEGAEKLQTALYLRIDELPERVRRGLVPQGMLEP